jgi:acetyl esterase
MAISQLGFPAVEPNTARFLQELADKGGPQLYELSVADARAAFTALQSGAVAKPSADVQELMIPGGPSGTVPIRAVRPKGVTEMLPAVVYVHGAGWVLGGWESHDRLVLELVNGANVAAIFVDFTLSPEARYPVAIEQAYAAARWVAENGAALNVDSSRLAIAGDSVGGNMAIAVTMLAKQRGGPKIDFQLLFYPVTDASFDTPSYQQFASGYFLTREAMKWFWNHYLPDVARRSEPTASPLRAPDELLEGLPPALVINGECDVLRDEAKATRAS